MPSQEETHYCHGEGGYFPLSQFTQRDGPFIHNVPNCHYDNGLPCDEKPISGVPSLPQDLIEKHGPPDE